ncbi:MAG: winged helix-turn-helix transcriptional regulator [Betaproteobacteria bacterium]|nr:winged helix-turn-helix domain-containing protein [Betaproteobacteria bacterium]MDE2047128.1 winged helix-turn-helix transcriptional regulator [Betaproteobacteria bacterium]
MNDSAPPVELDAVFEQASDLFAVLSAPSRLKILHFLCDGERSVNDILEFVGSSQPNVSQHLGLMYRAGILGKRKDGNQVLYRVVSERATSICRSVCTQIAIDLSGDA